MADMDKNAALILALSPKGKGASMSGGDDASGDADDDVEKAAAGDILDAIKERDQDALQSALHRFVSSCMASYDKDPEEEATEDK